MNHQYNNSKLAAAINGQTSSSSTHSNHLQIQQQQQQQQQQTTDAIIVQSNSSVVSDEFIQQLQEQFGGENKQIYILNNNQTQGSNSSSSNNQSNDQNQSVQYLIVDKDVDINVILQDPNIFNQTNLGTQNGSTQPVQQHIQHQSYSSGSSNNLLNEPAQIQQHQQQIPVHQQNQHHQPSVNSKPYLAKQQFINQNNSNNRYSNNINQIQKNNSTTNSSSQSSQNNNLINNQSNVVEESIQRVQVPPPKRKQFELKLENKKNSYQDVFLRFLAGEKQPTLEIIADPASKKPKDNLYYSNGVGSNGFNGNSTNAKFNLNQSQNKTAISAAATSAQVSSPAVTIQSNGISQTASSSVTNGFQSNSNQTTNINGTGNSSGTIDKENYYNSSRRENLLPLNNYEYRNSYKDHYDNQGVRVNPAVLKNLSYSSPAKSMNNNATNGNTTNSNQNINGSITEFNGSSRSITPQNRIPGQTADKISNNSNISNGMAILTENIDTNGLSDVSKQKNANISKSDQLTNQLYEYTDNQTQNNKLGNGTAIVDGLQGVVNNNMTSNNTTSNGNIINGNSSHNTQTGLNKTNGTTTSQLGNVQNLEQQKGMEGNFVGNNVQQQQQPNETEQHGTIVNVDSQQQLIDVAEEEVTFAPGEFLIHKSTFSGDFDNYDIWCVLDDGYLQKYEPVLLASGERCHQSADVLAQYTPDKSEFLLVKVDEKGKTEQNNIVVGVLNEYEPKNRKIFTNQQVAVSSTLTDDNTNTKTTSDTSTAASNTHAITSPSSTHNNNVVVVTYDDLKSTLDVFLQVLLSQHLNGEFLLRIKELQDEYFKPSIEFIDTILNEKYSLIISNFDHFMNLKKTEIGSSNESQSVYTLDDMFKYMFETKPKLISQEATVHTGTKCQAVSTPVDIATDSSLMATYIVKFSGQSYNPDTLIPITDFTNNPMVNEQYEKEGSNKEFLVCAKSLKFAQLCHSVKHLKINFYEICQQKIEQVKSQINESSDATAASEILNYCLADNQWLLEMFERFKQLLFDVDSLLSDDQQLIEHSNENQQNVQTIDLTKTATQTPTANIQNGVENHLQHGIAEDSIKLDQEQTASTSSEQMTNVNQHQQSEQQQQQNHQDFQHSESMSEIQTMNSNNNSGIPSVETNKLINDQISQIIDDVEEINQMETS